MRRRRRDGGRGDVTVSPGGTATYTKKEARISTAARQITGQQEAAGPGDSEAAGRGAERKG